MVQTKTKAVTPKKVPILPILTEKQLIGLDKYSERLLGKLRTKIEKRANRFEKKKKGTGKLAKKEMFKYIQSGLDYSAK